MITSSQFGFAQVNSEKAYNFHPPLDIPLILAGNFGELRSNHFHTGLDFKTNRREGLNVYAVDNGFVSRIKVSPYGYGKVVYIDHHNGLTSVYAHCSDFIGDLDSLVKDTQHKHQHYEIDYYPPEQTVRVKKGQIIALSGNTGGSSAPHLHFELRDTKTERALNPLLFGFDIKDTRKPVIRGMKVYSVTDKGYRIPGKDKRISTYGIDGNYKIKGDQITLPANFTSDLGGIGFAFDAIDQLDGADNICGIYKAYLIVDKDTVFIQEMTGIDFETNRYINCHKDYEEYHIRRKHYQKTFKTSHNPLPIYNFVLNNGIVKTMPDTIHTVKYVCIDAEGNSSQLQFNLRILAGEPSDLSTLYQPSEHFLFPDSAYMHEDSNYLIFFPPGTIYEPTELDLKQQSNRIKFGDYRIPIQDAYKLMIKLEDHGLPDEKYILTRKLGNRSYSLGGTVHKNWITAWINYFGDFQIETDTIPPVIMWKNFTDHSKIRKNKTLTWSMRDDLSGIVNYDLYINDEWYILNYEPKRGIYFFKPPSTLEGKADVLLRVIDACGNEKTENYTLFF